MLQSLDKFFADTKALLAQKNYAEAQPRLDDLLAKFPREPDILFLAGTCRIVRNEHGPGIALLERALDLGCEASECLLNLGNAYQAEGNLERAREYYERALALKSSAAAHANMATLYGNENNPQAAIDCCERALAIDPHHSLAHFNRSMGYLEQGRWTEGFRDFHKYSFNHSPRAQRKYDLPNRPCPEWDGSPNQTVAIWGEQGLGDELMYASCIPDIVAISKEVIIECDPRLEPLFRRSFPDCHVYGTTDQEKATWPWHHSIDASIAMGGLPQFFRKKVGDFPGTAFLKADEWQINRWRERFSEIPGTGPVVVLSWTGGLKRTRIEQRSISLEEWYPILEQSCRFVSLQWHEESVADAEKHGITVFPEAIQCFDFGASLVAAADLVISVTNTNVHLAGGLGQRCICLTPFNPAWPFARHNDADTNTWYGSVSHERQQIRGEWGPVIRKVADALPSILHMREAAE